MNRELLLKDPLLVLDNGMLFYKEIPFSGTLFSNYDNGSKKIEVQYFNGVKHGSEIKRYPNGTLAEERHYTNGLKSQVHRGFWDDGVKKFVYHFDDRGRYDGSVQEWYKTGVMLRAFNYVKGKESGSQKMWLPNGNIRANYEVINGERFGLIGLKKCYQVTSDSDKIQ